MKKLPEGEAKLRRDARNHAKNEARKAERRQKLEAAGLPLFKTPKDKREYNMLAQRKRRALQKALRPPVVKVVTDKNARRRELYAIRNAEKIAAKPLTSKEKAEARSKHKLQLEKIKRQQARENGKPDLRTKEARPGQHYKQVQAANKPKKILANSKAKPAASPKRKLPKQAARIVIPNTPSDRVKTWIPELKAHFYIRPGQTAADVIAKYSGRQSARITKW